ncbi:MAG TPA: preprotein translocase subunit SecE [Patescibacteria group bacterium]|nr:preprotein translocase subunit SecE [Patescibacteria group bacterium]
MRRIRRYFEESWSELKKVAWPTRDQVRKLTVLVFIVAAAVAVFIATWDFVFTEVVRLITPEA